MRIGPPTSEGTLLDAWIEHRRGTRILLFDLPAPYAGRGFEARAVLADSSIGAQRWFISTPEGLEAMDLKPAQDYLRRARVDV